MRNVICCLLESLLLDPQNIFVFWKFPLTESSTCLDGFESLNIVLSRQTLLVNCELIYCHAMQCAMLVALYCKQMPWDETQAVSTFIVTLVFQVKFLCDHKMVVCGCGKCPSMVHLVCVPNKVHTKETTALTQYMRWWQWRWASVKMSFMELGNKTGHKDLKKSELSLKA